MGGFIISEETLFKNTKQHIDWKKFASLFILVESMYLWNMEN